MILNHLEKILEFNSQYFPRFIFQNGQFQASVAYKKSVYATKHELFSLVDQQFAASELPTFHWVLVEFCVFIIVEELGFYYVHRLLHHRSLYKHIHKVRKKVKACSFKTSASRYIHNF